MPETVKRNYQASVRPTFGSFDWMRTFFQTTGMSKNVPCCASLENVLYYSLIF